MIFRLGTIVKLVCVKVGERKRRIIKLHYNDGCLDQEQISDLQSYNNEMRPIHSIVHIDRKKAEELLASVMEGCLMQGLFCPALRCPDYLQARRACKYPDLKIILFSIVIT